VARKSVKQAAVQPSAGGVQVTVVLPAEVSERLTEHAKAERRSRSNAAAILIEDALKALATRAASA